MDATKIAQHKWGTALIIENNEFYCSKILRFLPKHRTSVQHHKKKDETLYVISGSFVLEHEVSGLVISETMRQGEKIRLRPFTEHRISAMTKGEILETSTHHEDSDTYQSVPGGPIPK